MAEAEAANTSSSGTKEADDAKTEHSKVNLKRNLAAMPADDLYIEDNPAAEYEQLLNKLKSQNETFNRLKLRLIELECEECTCQVADLIEKVRCRMEVEKENLRLLVKEVIKFQRDHPNGPCEEIEIATHLSEDNIPDGMDAALCTAMLRMQQAKECKDQKLRNSR